MKKNLTNAELITILSQCDPKAPVNIFVDYCLWDGEQTYPDIDEKSGVCYSEEDDQLVIFAGEFEC